MATERDYKQQHWIVPCRGTIPPDQFQAFLTEYTDTMVFISILYISQFEKKNTCQVAALGMNIIASHQKILTLGG